MCQLVGGIVFQQTCLDEFTSSWILFKNWIVGKFADIFLWRSKKIFTIVCTWIVRNLICLRSLFWRTHSSKSLTHQDHYNYLWACWIIKCSVLWACQMGTCSVPWACWIGTCSTFSVLKWHVLSGLGVSVFFKPDESLSCRLKCGALTYSTRWCTICCPCARGLA